MRFILIYIDLNRSGALERICADPGLGKDSIISLRWVINLERWSATQTVATGIAKFNSSEVINQVIKNDILTGGKHLKVELMEPEPSQCYNCKILGTGHIQ